MISEILGACERAGAADTRVELARARIETWTGHRLERAKWLPPWELAQDHQVVQTALAALGRVGIAAQPAAYQFCTNAAYTSGVAGIATIGFGPGREELAHVVDEYIDIDQLVAARRGYQALAEALLSV